MLDTLRSLNCSIVGSEEVVAGGEGVSLSSHPVTEEEGGEEADEGGVDWADTEGPDVDGPADNPEVRESNSRNLLQTKGQNKSIDWLFELTMVLKFIFNIIKV